MQILRNALSLLLLNLDGGAQQLTLMLRLERFFFEALLVQAFLELLVEENYAHGNDKQDSTQWK